MSNYYHVAEKKREEMKRFVSELTDYTL